MLDTDGRHDAIQEFRDAFEFDHLPEGLPQTVCAVFHDAAAALLAALPDGPALTRSIHDVWRAKNEAVRFAVRIRTEGHAGRPAAVFRGSEPAHETLPVERTELRPQDSAPGRERPDVPTRAANPFESTTLGDTDRVLFPDLEPQLPDMRFGEAGEWPDHDEDNPDTSEGRHTLTDDTPASALRHETAEPKSGLTFVNDAGEPVKSHDVFPAQWPGTESTE